MHVGDSLRCGAADVMAVHIDRHAIPQPLAPIAAPSPYGKRPAPGGAGGLPAGLSPL